MRGAWLSSVLLLFTSYAAAGAITPEEYHARRSALRKNLDGTMVLFGRTESADEIYAFIQEPNFYYLTGWSEPGAILLIAPSKETLFLPHHNPRYELFTGRRASAEDPGVQSLTGFGDVLPVEKFEAVLEKALQASEDVYVLPDQARSAKLKRAHPLREFSSAVPLLTRLRVKKSPAEIEEIRHATAISVRGHLAAWKRLTPGLFEYQLAATASNVFFDSGCERNAYSPIAGSGPNAAILHYSANKRRMKAGDLVVMDEAAECGDYASDITRTLPVSGKFTPRQLEIYKIVLGAQKAALAAVRPGARLNGDERSLTAAARAYMDGHGKDSRGEPLGKYFTHSIGHQVGLEVHDPDPGGPLEAGMVITIEPGIYIPEENIGVRIEDIALVTDTGAQVLSAGLPKEPGEIEKALAVR